MNRKIAQGETSRAQLVGIGRRLFAAHGYDATSIDAVLREAKMSRGALYHHFASKEALFAAVLETVEADVARAITKAAGEVADPVAAFAPGAMPGFDWRVIPSFVRSRSSMPRRSSAGSNGERSTSATRSGCCGPGSRLPLRPGGCVPTWST